MNGSGRQLHVLFIPAWYFDEASEGIFIREHARMMLRQNCRVGLIYARKSHVFGSDQLHFSDDHGIGSVISTGYRFPKIAIGWTLWQRAYDKLWKAYVQKYGKPDLIHAHGYLAGIAACSLASRNQLPYIITEHSTAIPAGQIPQRHFGKLKDAYDHASGLIAVSDFLARSMGELTQREVGVIGNPVDIESLSIKRDTLQHPIRLLTIGSLEPRKNYTLLLDALAIVRKYEEVHLTIIGVGPLMQVLQNQARVLNLQNAVVFAGSVSDAELRTHLANADLFVASSVMENFGVAMAEALASGLPVVTTRSGGPEEFITAHVGRLAEHNAESLARAIKESIEHYDQFHPETIRAEVSSKFSFPVIGSQVRALYDSVLTVQ